MKENQKNLIRKLREIGTSYGQIAHRLGISENTVKSLCRREHIFNLQQPKHQHCLCCNIPLKGAQRHYCSDSCRYKWNYQHRILDAENAKRLVCKNCGEIFYSYPSSHKIYCSRECYIEARFGERRHENEACMD